MTPNEEIFILEKNIWTESDFELMGWHDAQIHAFAFEYNGEGYTGNFLIDIDYIFKWVNPKNDDENFSFWISPCTLVFINAMNLDINIQTNNYGIDTQEISDIKLFKEKAKDNELNYVYKWGIELQTGYINLDSDSFTQIVRKKPILISSQKLSQEERNGISFNKKPF